MFEAHEPFFIIIATCLVVSLICIISANKSIFKSVKILNKILNTPRTEPSRQADDIYSWDAEIGVRRSGDYCQAIAYVGWRVKGQPNSPYVERLERATCLTVGAITFGLSEAEINKLAKSIEYEVKEQFYSYAEMFDFEVVSFRINMVAKGCLKEA